VKGCEGFSVNYLTRTRIRDLHTDPSHPSQLLKTKGLTLHCIPFTPFTHPSPVWRAGARSGGGAAAEKELTTVRRKARRDGGRGGSNPCAAGSGDRPDPS
jgi:hypothetical protein